MQTSNFGDVASHHDSQVDLPNQINKTRADIEAGIIQERATVFGSLLTSDIPEREKSMVRLADEASSVLGAGTETTSWALTVVTYHLLTKPDMLAKLTSELRSTVDNPQALPTWTTLEKLPYLHAVVQEGLRLSYGISARTGRVPTGENLYYRGEWTPSGQDKPIELEYMIPQGFAISMSAVVSHHDEDVYPDSHSFIPERWLDPNPQRVKELEQSLLCFSKGSRACLGMK
jgi:cytochrome P450